MGEKPQMRATGAPAPLPEAGEDCERPGFGLILNCVPAPFSTLVHFARDGAARALFFLLFAGTAAAATVSTGTDEGAGLPYWELETAGMMLRLVQRLPDQTRGFFQARGFRPADADLVARRCVFQTIFKNTSSDAAAAVLEYNLRDWTVHHRGRARTMKTREDWQPVWAGRGVPQEAQIAFEWALLPTRQTYHPGDYNWGMSVFDLEPGAVFDLKVAWTQDGRRQTALLEDMRCGPEVGPRTQDE